MIVQKIIDDIAEILNSNFSDTEIYTEEVQQGLATPCFFVFPINVSDLRHIGRRWQAKYSMCVQYIPDSEEPKAECVEVEEKLYKLLEYITVDGCMVGGIDINSETTDEVLSFFVTYRMLTLERPADEIEKMEDLKGDFHVKENN